MNMKEKKSGSAKKWIKKLKTRKHDKFKDFCDQNSREIDQLLEQYWTPELKPQIDQFMADILAGKETNLKIPAQFGPGLASLLLSNISLWLGNTQEALKHQRAIKSLQFDQ